MNAKGTSLLIAIVLTFSLCLNGASHKVRSLTAGGTETNLGLIDPGQGYPPVPGGKIRGVKTMYQDTLIGPAGEYASGSGPVTMNCNLDEDLTGPCWGTFEFANAKGTWKGVWEGQFNFALGAGSYKATAYGRGGLQNMILQTVAVYPGVPITGFPPSGYVYATVRIIHDR